MPFLAFLKEISIFIGKKAFFCSTKDIEETIHPYFYADE
jgi:hypothetical protein